MPINLKNVKMIARPVMFRTVLADVVAEMSKNHRGIYETRKQFRAFARRNARLEMQVLRNNVNF